MFTITTTITTMRRRRLSLLLQVKTALPREAKLIPLATPITAHTKIANPEKTKKVRNLLTKVARKVSAATEEVAVDPIEEETTTESTIRMRRASKL